MGIIMKMDKKMKKSRCPCCNYKTLPKGEYGAYSICPVCFWENDGIESAEEYSSPNHMTLEQGRKNYLEFGACDKRSQAYVREPKNDEK